MVIDEVEFIIFRALSNLFYDIPWVFFCCLQIWWIKANFAPVLSQNLPKIVLIFIKDKITGSRDQWCCNF